MSDHEGGEQTLGNNLNDQLERLHSLDLIYGEQRFPIDEMRRQLHDREERVGVIGEERAIARQGAIDTIHRYYEGGQLIGSALEVAVGKVASTDSGILEGLIEDQLFKDSLLIGQPVMDMDSFAILRIVAAPDGQQHAVPKLLPEYHYSRTGDLRLGWAVWTTQKPDQAAQQSLVSAKSTVVGQDKIMKTLEGYCSPSETKIANRINAIWAYENLGLTEQAKEQARELVIPALGLLEREATYNPYTTQVWASELIKVADTYVPDQLQTFIDRWAIDIARLDAENAEYEGTDKQIPQTRTLLRAVVGARIDPENDTEISRDQLYKRLHQEFVARGDELLKADKAGDDVQE